MANDFGIKIAKPGFDVLKAGDIDLIFSSAWPSLPIAKEISTSIYNGSTVLSPSTALVEHGLGFPPFTIGWTVIANKTHVFFPSVNEKNIRINYSFPNPTEYGYCNFKCFNIDLSKTIEYPFIKPPTTSIDNYDPNFGMKVTKEGKNIDSKDLRDYVLHSRCQSPQILTVQIGNTPTGGTVVYKSPLGYTSWVFGYVKLSTSIATLVGGYYNFAPYYAQAYPITVVNGSTNTYSVNYTIGDNASLVVLRDPMFSPTNINTVY